MEGVEESTTVRGLLRRPFKSGMEGMMGSLGGQMGDHHYHNSRKSHEHSP